MGWICTKCGQCCRHVDRVPSMKGFAREDGACVFLEGNLCSIYDRRPPVCDVARVYGEFFKGAVTEEEFYEMTARACADLQKGIVSCYEDSEPGEH